MKLIITVDRLVLQQEKQQLSEEKLNKNHWIEAKMSKREAKEMMNEMQQVYYVFSRR